MNLPSPIPVIDMAVSMRNISSLKEERMAAAELYKPAIKPITANKEVVIKQVHDALYFATIMCYAQGLVYAAQRFFRTGYADTIARCGKNMAGWLHHSLGLTGNFL